MRNLSLPKRSSVACYRNQSLKDPGWPARFANHYTERLRTVIDGRIISCFATTWDYDGIALARNTTGGHRVTGPGSGCATKGDA